MTPEGPERECVPRVSQWGGCAPLRRSPLHATSNSGDDGPTGRGGEAYREFARLIVEANVHFVNKVEGR